MKIGSAALFACIIAGIVPASAKPATIAAPYFDAAAVPAYPIETQQVAYRHRARHVAARRRPVRHHIAATVRAPERPIEATVAAVVSVSADVAAEAVKSTGALLGLPDGWEDGLTTPLPAVAKPVYKAVGDGLVRARLASGQFITVAALYADRFVGFLNALYYREGYLPEIGCYSPTGHMAGSLHHGGLACDVGQESRNVAWRPMYHITALAEQYGLTDGATWRYPDAGHVDVSNVVGDHFWGGSGHRYATRHHWHEHYYAHRHYRHYAHL